MVGKKLGHYRILGRLGVGGMGEVYRAEDLNLRRPVALKLLPQDMTQEPTARERLVREARAASRLSHQNIATIYEVGEHQGQLFFAMEFVQGRPLSKRLRLGPLPAADVIRIGAQAADALETAHNHGVVHRDIKPGNILLRGDGVVKVVDFGLAIQTKVPGTEGVTASGESTAAIRLTQTGFTAGTVAYMSPEQAQGESPDHRSDLFSLGVVLYEAATGKLPFKGPNPLATAAAIIHDDPLPPREVVPSLPAGLQEIILRCLSKERDSRPRTAAVVRDALLGLEEGRTTSTIRRMLGKRPLRRGLLLGTVGLLVAAGVVVGIWNLWEGLTPPLPIQDLEARKLFVQGQRYEQRGYTPEILKTAEKTYRDALASEPHNPLIKAHLAQLLASMQLQYPAAGRVDEIRTLSDQAIHADPDLAPAWIARGRLQLLEEKPEAAAEAARKAKASAPDSWEGYVLLGKALIALGQSEAGLGEMRKAMEVGEGHIWARTALARQLVDHGRLNEAVTEYEEVLRYAPDLANALNNLATIYLFTGRYLESIVLYKRLLKFQPEDDAAWSNLGSAYLYLDQVEDAINAYMEAHRIVPDNPNYERNLGDAYEKAGNPARARDWYGKAFHHFNLAIDAGGPRLELLGRRAYCAAKLGRYEEAIDDISHALDDDADNIYLLYKAAQVHAMAGNREESYSFVRQAIAGGYPREEFRRDLCFKAYHGEPTFQRLLVEEPS